MTSYDFRIDVHGKEKIPISTFKSFISITNFYGAKRLPEEIHLELDDVTPQTYLHHKSNSGTFFLKQLIFHVEVNKLLIQ